MAGRAVGGGWWARAYNDQRVTQDVVVLGLLFLGGPLVLEGGRGACYGRGPGGDGWATGEALGHRSTGVWSPQHDFSNSRAHHHGDGAGRLVRASEDEGRIKAKMKILQDVVWLCVVGD